MVDCGAQSRVKPIMMERSIQLVTLCPHQEAKMNAMPGLSRLSLFDTVQDPPQE